MLFIISLFFSIYTLFAYDVTDDLQQHKVSCVDCPDSVVTVVTMGVWGPSYCRGALIDNDRVITSGHCVQDLKEDCKGGVVVKSKDVVSSCEKIEYLDINQDDMNKSDIAIIRLSKPFDVGPAKLSAQSFDDNETLFYYKSKYDFSTSSSSMQRVDCKTKKYSSAVGDFFNDTPSVVSIKECPFDAGDSGSPIFNQRGELVAVLQGGLHNEALEAFSKIVLVNFNQKSYLDLLSENFNYNDSENIEFHPVIAATTIKCLTFLSGEACENINIGTYVLSELETIKNKFKTFVDSINRKSLVQWEFDHELAFAELTEPKAPRDHATNDFNKVVVSTPVCINKRGAALQPIQIIEVRVDAHFALYYTSVEKVVPINQEDLSGYKNLPKCGS